MLYARTLLMRLHLLKRVPRDHNFAIFHWINATERQRNIDNKLCGWSFVCNNDIIRGRTYPLIEKHSSNHLLDRRPPTSAVKSPRLSTTFFVAFVFVHLWPQITSTICSCGNAHHRSRMRKRIRERCQIRIGIVMCVCVCATDDWGHNLNACGHLWSLRAKMTWWVIAMCKIHSGCWRIYNKNVVYKWVISIRNSI